MKNYIVYVGFAMGGAEYSLRVSEDDLPIIIEAYKNGYSSFTLAGTQHRFLEPKKLGIYEVLNNEEFRKYIKFNARELIDQGFINKKWGNTVFTQKLLGNLKSIKNVTRDFLGNMYYGELKGAQSKSSDYISHSRIKELEQISNPSFDLTKVIKFCHEINDNWHRENYLSVGALVRALKDHVPPIFGCANFKEVANNYNGNGKSFKSSMLNLQNTSTNISDRLIHSHITNSVALPSDTQVNFSQEIDAMLEEIVRVLK